MPYRFTVFTPSYNRAHTLPKVYASLSKQTFHDFEWLIVDDGSTDASLQEILSLRGSDDRVKAVTFTRNFGQMAAQLAGFKHVSGSAIINISADLQDPVELIPKMIEQWVAGAEIVICYRTDRADTFSSKLFTTMGFLELSDVEVK